MAKPLFYYGTNLDSYPYSSQIVITLPHAQPARLESAMIIASLRMSVSPEKRDEALKTLRLVMGPTRAHLSCISCRLYQDVEDANLISFVQEWDSREAMAEHIRSKDYRNILAVMELASEPPEIKFVEALNTDGMELIEGIRG
jgi:quinol monooxygenase YgiN